MSFSYFSRRQDIERLKTEVFDLAIIGGGISGAGVARDAASRGMKVALVEANDFASGTSSRSSKLIHGGIRYLENLEFGLVFEALNERRILFDIAPHLVHPLRFVLPVYKGGRVGMWTLGAGMWLYDALSLFEAPQMHERLSAEHAMRRVPILKSQNLKGAYVYSDAYMDDDRLVIETMRSANAMGAVCVSYAACIGGKKEGERFTSLKIEDRTTGENFDLQAKQFVSTVGPWTDVIGQQLFPQWKRKMRPSKGVHLTFQRDRVPLSAAVVMISDDEKRIVFGIPRNDMVIIGTTDTDFPRDPAEVRTEREDVEYLLRIANMYFPGAELKESDIVASYSGVRPLVDDGSATESKTSREHEIYQYCQNFTFLTGGKYTTYRAMAKQTMESVVANLPSDKQVRFARSHTKTPLNPKATVGTLEKAERSIPNLARKFRVPESVATQLVTRHGEEAEEILHSYPLQNPHSESAVWELEAHHAISTSMCYHLLDFYLRRTPLFLSRPDHGMGFVDRISQVFAARLAWSETQVEAEKQSLLNHFKHEMGWRLI